MPRFIPDSLDLAMNESAQHVDPWTVFGRIFSGIVVYGAAGFGLDYWWGTSFMVGIGIAVGAALGIYAVVASTRAS